MSNILLMAFLSVTVLVLQVWLPGLMLCRLARKGDSWTLVDAYLMGWLWTVFLGILFVPLLGDIAYVSTAVRIVTAVLVVSLTLYYARSGDIIPTGEVIQASFGKVHIALGGGITFLILLFITTHNLGFDDISNLEYVRKVLLGNPYPVYISLVGEWEAARYPMWGVVMGTISHKIPGGGLFLYYFLGISILIAFLLKIYEFVIAGKANKTTALSTLFLVAVILMVASLDNYFNYGIYPLQQAKLLYLIGLLYLIIGWWLLRNRLYLLMGAGLITGATFYHINLFLLHAVVLPVGVLFIYYRKRVFKKWLFYTSVLVLPLIVSMPATLAPDNGFLQIREKPVEVSSGGHSVKKPEPTVFEILIKRFKQLSRWFEEGHYRYYYLQRALSLEVLLIPLLMIFIFKVSALSRLAVLNLFLSSAVIIYQLSTIVPRQLAASMLRSGPLWVVSDLYRSSNLTGEDGRTYTDPYTALFLKLLGVPQVQEMEPEQELMAFSPLFIPGGTGFTATRLEMGSKDRMLLNGRHWGVRSVPRWSDKGNRLYENLLESVTDFHHGGNLQQVPVIVRGGVHYLFTIMSLPIREYSIDEDKDSVVDYPALLEGISGKGVTIYGDSSLVTLENIKAGEAIRVDFEGNGDVVEFVRQFSGNEEGRPLRRTNLTNVRKTLLFEAEHNTDKVTLLFRLNLGHFNGLGTMETVTVTRQEPAG